MQGLLSYAIAGVDTEPESWIHHLKWWTRWALFFLCAVGANDAIPTRIKFGEPTAQTARLAPPLGTSNSKGRGASCTQAPGLAHDQEHSGVCAAAVSYLGGSKGCVSAAIPAGLSAALCRQEGLSHHEDPEPAEGDKWNTRSPH